MNAPDGARRLMSASALPLAYYATAHAGFALALAVLVIDPALPGLSFYQPRFIALVHVWQTHGAFVWLLVAVGLGLTSKRYSRPSARYDSPECSR